MLELKQAAFSDAVTFAAMEQGADVREFILPYSQEEHGQSLRDSRLVYLQILDRSVLVGFLLLALDPDGASIEFRRIVVAIRGKGIGQAAISAMEQFCRSELGRNRIWLDVFEHNHRGRYIYEKLGYQKFGETHLDGRLLLLYEKKL